MSLFKISAHLSLISEFILLGLAVFLWKRIPRDISSLRWILLASPFTDIGMNILGSFAINNLWLADLFMFMQFSILLYIFSLQFEQRNLLKISYMIITVFYLSVYMFSDAALKAFVGSNAIDGLFLIVVSIVFFYKLLNELNVVNIHRLPILWIAFATLFYYSGNLFIFLATSSLENDYNSFTFVWTLHNILNIIKNIFFAVALWQSYRTVKSL